MAERIGCLWRRYWVEIGWWVFVLVNVAGILMFREWATVPFHFIWISLSLLYGWRVWAMRPTSVTLGAIIIVTGFSLGTVVMSGDQGARTRQRRPRPVRDGLLTLPWAWGCRPAG